MISEKLCLVQCASTSMIFFLFQITTTVEQVRDFMKGTLLSVQEAHVSPERSLWDLTVESIETLKQKSLIEVSADLNNQTILQITRLGRATFKGKTEYGMRI